VTERVMAEGVSANRRSLVASRIPKVSRFFGWDGLVSRLEKSFLTFEIQNNIELLNQLGIDRTERIWMYAACDHDTSESLAGCGVEV
jgi:hypothetical protein